MLDRNNIKYEILLDNEYNEVYTDDMIADMLEKRKRGLEDDSRPQIGEDYNRKVNDVLVNKEQEKIIQEYETSERREEVQKKTIMDMPLKDIFQNHNTSLSIQETLYYLTKIYKYIDEIDIAKEYAAILAYNFPNSIWYEKSYNLINDIEIQQNKKGWFNKFNPIKLFINDQNGEDSEIQKID